MEGRWTIPVDDGVVVLWPWRAEGHVPRVPVVPCDDAAVERGAQAIYEATRTQSGLSHTGCYQLARIALRAAGETP